MQIIRISCGPVQQFSIEVAVQTKIKKGKKNKNTKTEYNIILGNNFEFNAT